MLFLIKCNWCKYDPESLTFDGLAGPQDQDYLVKVTVIVPSNYSIFPVKYAMEVLIIMDTDCVASNFASNNEWIARKLFRIVVLAALITAKH